nr:MAG TPA: hypothetical protein [Caudoviricetes sp.]
MNRFNSSLVKKSLTSVMSICEIYTIPFLVIVSS